jgi:hypothetical protein
MSRYSRIMVPMLAAALLVACGGGDSNADSALATDTSMARDLQLAQTDTAAQPQLTDVPATPASKTAPAAKRPAASTKTTTPTKTASGNTKTSGTGTASRTGVIAAGTQLSVRANRELCTNTGKVGDSFTATVNESVVGSNGATIPAGATVTLTVTKLNRSENVNDPIEMEFSVNQVSFGGKSYSLSGSSVASLPVEKVRNQPKSKDVQKVVGGAAVGAIAGQILGKNTKSTVIGAAAGAAAGAATAAATANYEGCVRAGGTFVVNLGNALTIST